MRLLVPQLLLLGVMLFIASCGGGSYGTGVRDLVSRPAEDPGDPSKSSAIELPWFRSANCEALGAVFSVHTEFGPTDRRSGYRCSADVASQAGAVSVAASGLSAEARYSLERTSCAVGERSTVEADGQWPTSPEILRLPKLRWAGTDRYVLTVTQASGVEVAQLSLFRYLQEGCDKR